MTVTTSSRTYNGFAIAAAILAVLAAVSMFLVSIPGLAIFAVGAGHVAVNQIARKGERGRRLAAMALAVGYAIGLWSIFVAAQVAFN
jgi:hypothetical protein